jgi:2-oxoglutarate ferredoxin oxidoreductase subunit alpha
LLQALYGRNGEAPVPVIAAYSPSDCFNTAFEACRLAIEFMTPVFFLSDGYIANGSEPWKFPTAAELPDLKVSFAKNTLQEGEKFLPYKRNEKLAREWAIPGTKGLEHRVGGIEKENETGNISYDPINHELMVKTRRAKVDGIADYVPLQTIDNGNAKGKLLVLGWGSTYGSIKTAVKMAIEEGYDVSHAHVKYLNPFPKNLEQLLRNFDKVLIPEINNGQLIKVVRDKYLIDAKGLNKIQGVPFTSAEIKEKIAELIR